ncbi:hypothetical protein BGX26_011972 [Mortierella sp. AD094]|nr:hypothetical protein BGX26_011972 [Mortierella sp. AD094]
MALKRLRFVVCLGGGFYERARIPEYLASNSSFLHTATSQPIPGEPRVPKIAKDDVVRKCNIEKIQNYYASCTNEDQLDKIGREPLIDEI